MREYPTEPFRWLLDEVRHDLGCFRVVGRVHVPASGAYIILEEVDDRGAILLDEAGARGQEEKVGLADRVALREQIPPRGGHLGIEGEWLHADDKVRFLLDQQRFH